MVEFSALRLAAARANALPRPTMTRHCLLAGAVVLVAMSSTSSATARTRSARRHAPKPAATASTLPAQSIGKAGSSAAAKALVSRPRWEMNGSSIAPPALTTLPQRTTAASAPRASALAAITTRNPNPMRLAATPARAMAPAARLDEMTAITMSVTAPGAASADSDGRVTMRMEVPTSASRRATGQILGGRPQTPTPVPSGAGASQSSGAAASGVVVSEAERKRRADVALQQQFERARVNKAQKEQMLITQAFGELDRAEKHSRRAQSELTGIERDLNQLRGTLRTAFLDAGPDATGLNPFVRAAQHYAGTPYVWGGESRTGFDCSGFIMVVMRDLGYKALPHSAAEQFNYGTPIPLGQLKPGDLVFFANTYKPGISHVGIYLGKGSFIHAAGTGKGTIVSRLAASPYAQKYAGARRLFKNS